MIKRGRTAVVAVDQTSPAGLLARACAPAQTVLENVTREQLRGRDPNWPDG